MNNSVDSKQSGSNKACALPYQTVFLLLLPVVTAVIYSNTLAVPFVFDDIPNIVENARLRDMGNFWPPAGQRFVGFLSFALNYSIGGLDVTGYHLINMLIHAANGLLVFSLFAVTLKTPFFAVRREMQFSEGQLYAAAFAAALLFAAHPVQTQAVTYTVQRFSSLAVLFYLLALLIYAMLRLSAYSAGAPPGTQQPLRRLLSRNILLNISVVLLSVLAMATKETALTLPIVLVLYEVLFFEGAFGQRIRVLLPFMLPVIVIPLSLLQGTTAGALAEQLMRGTLVETEGVSIDRTDYLFTQIRVVMTYIRLLFWPVNQMVDYDYPVLRSFFVLPVILSLTAILLLLGLAVFLVRRSGKDHGILRLAAFGILWFFITLIVESGFVPIPHVIFEHRLYLPSIGIAFFCASFALFLFGKRPAFRMPLMVLLGAAIISLGTATYARNSIWTSEASLWEDNVHKAPQRTAPHYHLGSAYLKSGRYREAVAEFRLAALLSPDYPEIYFMWGQSYFKLGWMNDARMSFEKAISLRPAFPEAHNALGNALVSSGMTEAAIMEYMTALSQREGYDEARRNLDAAMRLRAKQRNQSR